MSVIISIYKNAYIEYRSIIMHLWRLNSNDLCILYVYNYELTKHSPSLIILFI